MYNMILQKKLHGVVHLKKNNTYPLNDCNVYTGKKLLLFFSVKHILRTENVSLLSFYFR